MSETTSGPAVEIPQYRCHKVVRAAKITGALVDEGDGFTLQLGEIDGRLNVSAEWMGRHAPAGGVVTGGYYVVYADGYSSFSPAKAFEEGYARIERGRPGQFRKKPVVIEAFQVHPDDGRTRQLPPAWLLDAMVAESVKVAEDEGLDIATLEGVMHASVGDWVIRGVKGELYPCKPDIFAATYDPA